MKTNKIAKLQARIERNASKIEKILTGNKDYRKINYFLDRNQSLAKLIYESYPVNIKWKAQRFRDQDEARDYLNQR